MRIVLAEEVDPDSEELGFWLDENKVTVRSELMLSVYSLPKGSRRVTMSRLGNGRQELILGGFKSITVAVTGPTEAIKRLREAVL